MDTNDNPSIITMPELERHIYWKSRRGMLELDLVLIPFIKSSYPTLSDNDKATFDELLNLDDPTLLSWLVYGVEPMPEYANIVRLIRQFQREKLK